MLYTVPAQSGHFTCSRERTDHKSTTPGLEPFDTSVTVCYNRRRMRAFVRYALDALFPRRCAVCRRAVPANESGAICGMCWAAIARIEGPQCPVCGSPFRSDAALSHSPTHRCGACRETPPSFTQAVSAGLYEGVLAEAIRGCKYRNIVKLIPALSPLLRPALDALPAADAVVPVPLHPRRLRQRGFNQSLLLARVVAGHNRKPLIMDRLIKDLDTHPQIGLSAKERAANLKGAFSVRGDFRDMSLLLVDDVMTTGATVSECSKQLLEAGAKKIVVLTLARASAL